MWIVTFCIFPEEIKEKTVDFNVEMNKVGTFEVNSFVMNINENIDLMYDGDIDLLFDYIDFI